MISSFLTLHTTRMFDLERTVWLMRRLEANIVDRLSGDGRFLRMLDADDGHALLVVRQSDATTIHAETAPAVDSGVVEAYLTRRFALRRDMGEFEERAARIAWLAPLLPLLAGVHPPRYPTLWEACVNAVVFQQISLSAATAILTRVVRLCAAPGKMHDTLELRPFPPPQALLDASSEALRHAGLSAAKISTLKRIASAVLAGSLREEDLQRRDSPGAVRLLCEFPGIGPWTATVILLRGMGRLDVFPENDSGAAKSLHALEPGLGPRDVAQAREILGDLQGMLYFSLLMARLRDV